MDIYIEVLTECGYLENTQKEKLINLSAQWGQNLWSKVLENEHFTNLRSNQWIYYLILQ